MFRPRPVLVLLLIGGLLTTIATPALASAPSNDGFDNAIPVSGLPFSDTVAIGEATAEGGERVPCDPVFPFPAQTVWYSITPTSSAVLRVANGATFQRHFIAVFRQDGTGLDGLTDVACASWIFGQNATTFGAEAGETYYIQAGSNSAGSTGTVTVSIEQIPPPAHDDFEDAAIISSLPYEDIVDASAATFEEGEPQPSCASSLTVTTVWYAWTPSQTGEYMAQNPYSSSGFLAVGAYSGTGFDSLSEVGCGLVGRAIRFHAEAGVTHYFQVIRQSHQPGSMNFRLELLQPDNQPPIGTHDVFEGDVAGPECFAAGWAVDPDDLSARLTVRISGDGAILGEGTADLFRQDLIDAGISPDGLAGFGFDLRGRLTAGEPHTILVEVQDAQSSAWQPLDATPKVINCANSSPVGTHDGVDGTQPPWACAANGWAVDPNDRTARLTVRVLVDGQEVTSSVADLYRQDLVDAGVSPDGFAGFNILLWGLISHGLQHEIRVQAQDNETTEWFDLDATPMTLRCSVPPPRSGIGFTGLWTATDLDGSALRMHIGPGDTPQIAYRDSYSTQCDTDASPRWVGAGKGDYLEIWLFVTFHKPGCDPFELQFYWDEGSDTLWEDEDGDGVGITWHRAPPG